MNIIKRYVVIELVFFLCQYPEIKNIFPYFSTKTYVMGTKKYSLVKVFFCEDPKQMLNFQPKVKLWAHKRTVSMRRWFCALKTNVQTDWWENIHNLTLNYMYFCLSVWFCIIVVHQEKSKIRLCDYQSSLSNWWGYCACKAQSENPSSVIICYARAFLCIHLVKKLHNHDNWT